MAKNQSFIKLFEKSADVGPLPHLLKIIIAKFVAMNWDEFKTLFVECITRVMIKENSIHCMICNNMIKFAANSVSMLCEHSTKDGRTGTYLLTETIQLCSRYGNATDKIMRWRCCLFLDHLLNTMADKMVLPVELCDVATSLLLDRLQDTNPEVRAQAAHALHRLQTYQKYPIVKQFLFHLTCDPSVKVRIAIIKEIAMLSNVVDEILKYSLLDNSNNVRKEAYNRILAYPFLNLSSKQRQMILEKGMEDKNKSIELLVKNRLLQNWFEDCNNDVVQFLKKIGVENEVICEKTLNTMFETRCNSQILDLINKYLNPDFRTVDFDKLTVENVFLWTCVAKYLTREKKIELPRNQGHIDDDYIEILLPDLIAFSDYVRNYYFTRSFNNDKEFILTQLLNIVNTFAIDDVGAASLNKLCFDLLLDNNTSVKPIKPITQILNLTLNGPDLLIYVKQILNEIQIRTNDKYHLINKIGNSEILRLELISIKDSINELLKTETKNNIIEKLMISFHFKEKKLKKINVSPKENALIDTAIKDLLKTFELVFQVQQLPKVGNELSLLSDIIENFVARYLDCSMVNLRIETIRSLAPYMLIKKEYITILWSQISKPETFRHRHRLFKILFELFFSSNDLKTDFDSVEDNEDVSFNDNILRLLANVIDYEVIDSSFHSVIINGFCKLLIFNKIKSVNLLSKFLIIFFRHLSRNTFNIHNDVKNFFTSYVKHINSSSSMLAKCYVQVLREIKEHNLSSKLAIKLDEVNSTLINLTGGHMFQNKESAINAHGELAGYIFDYLIEENQPYTNMLVDTLYKLEIDFDSDEKLVHKLYPKLLCVIKYMKNLDGTRETQNYVKKIMHKFGPVLLEKCYFMSNFFKKNVDAIQLKTDMIPTKYENDNEKNFEEYTKLEAKE